MRELSLAYTFEPDFTPGETPDGEKYDYVQRKIRANHLALVETGRAGPEVRVRDSNKDFLNMEKDDAVEQAEVTLAKAIIDLHSVDPNGKIVDGAQDDDKDAMIQKIIEGLKAKGLTDEEAEKLKTTLSDLAYSQATGDEDPKPDEQKEAQDDDPELDEKMKDPNFKAGFEAGVLYGEKREKDDPKRLDSDHEREGEERYLEKEAEDALKSCGLDEASEEEKKAFAAGLNYAQKKDEGETSARRLMRNFAATVRYYPYSIKFAVHRVPRPTFFVSHHWRKHELHAESSRRAQGPLSRAA